MEFIVLPIIQEPKGFLELLFNSNLFSAFIATLTALVIFWLGRNHEIKKARKELLREKAAEAQTLVDTLMQSNVLVNLAVNCQKKLENKGFVKDKLSQADVDMPGKLTLIIRQYFRELIKDEASFISHYYKLVQFLFFIQQYDVEITLDDFKNKFNSRIETLSNLGEILLIDLDKYFDENNPNKLAILWKKFKDKLWLKQTLKD